MVSFEKVLNGIVKYINDEILPNMNDWQEVAARIAMGRLLESQEAVKQALMANGIVRTFGIMDTEGNVDAERLFAELRKEVSRKGKMQVSVPVFGKFTFTATDVDRLHDIIKGGYL